MMARLGGALAVLGVLGLLLYGWLIYADVKTDNFNCGPVIDPSESASYTENSVECFPALSDRRDQVRWVGWAGLTATVLTGGTLLIVGVARARQRSPLAVGATKQCD
jgi:hypothetical protein